MSRGRLVEPRAIRRTALLCVEGEKDDICAVVQTLAAQELCTGLSQYMKEHHMQPGVGHYGVFNGPPLGWTRSIHAFARVHLLARLMLAAGYLRSQLSREASMLDKTRNTFSHVKPGDTAFRIDGLRDFFKYRDLGIAEATNGKVIAQLVRANAAPEKGTGGTTTGRNFTWC